MIKKTNRKGGMALSQIMILLVGTIAFAYLVGQIGVVKATTQTCSQKGGTPCSPDQECSGGGGLVDSSDYSFLCCLGTCTGGASPSTTSGGIPSDYGQTNPPASGTASTEISQGASVVGGGAALLAPGAAPAASTSEAAGTFGMSLKDISASAAAGAGNTAAGAPGIFSGAALPKFGIMPVLEAAAIAAATYFILDQIKGWLGIKKGTSQDAAFSAFQFAATGFSLGASIAGFSGAAGGFFGTEALALGGIGIGVAIVLFAILYKQTKTDAVVVTCSQWQAPSGGADCAKCGASGRLPCDKYQCSGLGTGCKFITDNRGRGICAYVYSSPNQPAMTFLNLLSSDYSVTPISAGYINQVQGVVVTHQGGDIPANANLPLGIVTDLPSTCIVSPYNANSYDNMSSTGYIIGSDGGVSGSETQWGDPNPDGTYNHTFNFFTLNGIGGVNITQDGQINLYIRCKSANGIADIGEFVIQMTVSQQSDSNAPTIYGTSFSSSTAAIPSGIASESIFLYTRDPVTGCNWDHNDPVMDSSGFDKMSNSLIGCTQIPTSCGIFGGLCYSCIANLTGIKSNSASNTNDFYFRCKSANGITNVQSYHLQLTGSQSLVISSATPNGTTVTDSTQSIHVTLNVMTAGGSDQGQATCSYSATGNPTDYSPFSTSTNSYQNSQDLWLSAGAYSYYIRCVDPAGNAAFTTINFNVKTQNQAPFVIRASRNGGNLNIQTNVNGSCVYDIIDCTYPIDQGIAMDSIDGTTFSTAWVAGRTYYIKCQDSFENQPAPNSCSIVLSPSSV